MKTQDRTAKSKTEAPKGSDEPVASQSRSWLNAVLLLGVFAVWRVVLFAVGLLAKATIQPNPLLAQWQSTKHGLAIWNQWDANYYLSIASRGYELPDWPAFFPLYPLVLRAVRLLLFNTISMDAVALLTNIFLTGSTLILIFRLGAILFDPEAGKRSAFYLLAFPTAMYLGIAYSESLYLLTTVSAFYAAERKKWWLAGLMGALASATRLTGILVLPALLVAYLQSKQWKLKELGLAWLWLGLVPTGLIAYFTFLAISGHGFFGYFEALEIGWPGRSISWQVLSTPFVDVLQLIRGDVGSVWAGFVAIIDFLAIVIAAVGLWFVWRSLPKQYFVYSALILGAMLASSLPLAASRYVLGMFPLFLVLGKLGNSTTVERVYIVLSVPLLGLYTAMYATGYWVA